MVEAKNTNRAPLVAIFLGVFFGTTIWNILTAHLVRLEVQDVLYWVGLLLADLLSVVAATSALRLRG